MNETEKIFEAIIEDIPYIPNYVYSNLLGYLNEKDEEIERLNNIIKEVREYIEKDMKKYGGDIYITCKDILEILDKEKI